MSESPTAADLVRQGTGFLTRTHLRELGLERRAIDAAFRECPAIVLPGYSRPMIQVEAFLALVEGATYCDRCGDRVRPTAPLTLPRAHVKRPDRSRANGPAGTRPRPM